MTDYTKMDAPGLINACGEDACQWAEAFCQLNPEAVVLPMEVISGWFANAMGTAVDCDAARRRRGDCDAAFAVQNILALLRNMEQVEAVFENIKVQLTDEAVYEHLKTSAEVLDDEDDKARMRDLAEFFASEFCCRNHHG